jgi:hypothetical protein
MQFTRIHTRKSNYPYAPTSQASASVTWASQGKCLFYPCNNSITNKAILPLRFITQHLIQTILSFPRKCENWQEKAM